MTESITTAPTTKSSQGLFLKASLVANVVFLIGIVGMVFAYLQTTSELTNVKTDLSSVKTELAMNVARASELKSDLNAARGDIKSLSAQSSKLKEDVESKEKSLSEEKAKAESVQTALDIEKARAPSVPVRVEYRRSGMGKGLVGMFTNSSGKYLPVMVSLTNPTTNQNRQLSFQAAPGKKTEIGHLEGWAFASGDQISISSAGYETVSLIVP